MANRPSSSMSRGESELINKCQRALDDGTEKSPIEKLRLLCLARGASGIAGIGRAFRRMGDDDNKALSLDEFIQGLKDSGMECSDDEAAEIFNQFDPDGSVAINMSEFLAQLRVTTDEPKPPHIIGEAFKKLDKTGDGVITTDDLKNVYSVRNHPQFISSEQTAEQILNRFLANFEEGGVVDGRVTEEEFINYYAGISASIDNDVYFDLMMRQAYKL